MPSLIRTQQQQIAETYFANPFHNWPHWKYVGDQVMFLEWVKNKVTPGRMAGYFHDADHRWFVQEDDEERAAKIAHDMQ